MPTLNQFQNNIVVAGAYVGPPANGPVLRDAAGTSVVDLQLAGHPLTAGSQFTISVPAGGGPPSLATTPVVGVGATVPHPTSGGQQIQFTAPAGAADAIFLPFVQDMICYTLLPADPASNVDVFFTDNLSGCSVFIDRVDNTNDLVVYHANRVTLTATPNPAQYLADTPFPDQYRMARHTMRGDHDATRAVVSAAVGALTERAKLERFDYYACVDKEMNRKRRMERRNVTALAGTNVMGFRVAGAWQFWWQTWASLDYDRPLGADALRLGVHQQGNAELLDVQPFLQ